MIVYKATNNLNGKVYIGQTIGTLANRKAHHIYDAANDCRWYFHNAVRKHGKDNFYWVVLNECDDRNILNQLEEHYISCYDSVNTGYNLTSGGDSDLFSSDTRVRPCGKAHWNYGKHLSDETKRKISETMLREGTTRGRNHPNYGKYRTAQTKERISQSRLKYLAEVKDLQTQKMSS